MSRKGNILFIILAAVGILTASVGGYFWYSSQKSKAGPVTETKSKDKTTNPEATRSASWKTYTNEKYGYEFRYPIGLGTISESGSQTRLMNGMGYVLEIIKIPTTDSLGRWLDTEKKSGQFPDSDWTATETQLAGRPALFLQSHYLMQVPGDTYAIKTNGAIYTIFFAKENALKSTMDQILSTFKFIDKNVTSSTTYFNKDQSFSMEIPTDFKTVPPSQPYYTLDNPVITFLSSQSDYKIVNYTQESVISISYVERIPISGCFQPINETKQINGTIFHLQPPSDSAGAGNHYGRTLYRTGTPQKCFEIALTVHTSSDWNNIDTEKSNASITSAKSRLEQILTTFKFL